MLHVIITSIKDKYYLLLFPNQHLPALRHHPVILTGKWSLIRRLGLPPYPQNLRVVRRSVITTNSWQM